MDDRYKVDMAIAAVRLAFELAKESGDEVNLEKVSGRFYETMENLATK